MMLALNYKEVARLFERRSYGYFDSTYQLLRPKNKDGRFVEPFDPLERNKERGWNGSGGIGFVEGNAWQYTFFAPHDVKGLIHLFGSEAAFSKKLQTCFDSGYFNMNNEPDIAYPFLFNYVKDGQVILQKTVDALRVQYFKNEPGGLPGNDDCGTLSAWVVFVMMGIYPDCVGRPDYQVFQPVFDKIEIQPDQTKERIFVIERKRNEIFINKNKAGKTITHIQLTK
jgi:predicted alpha-1,2-mannosidase